MSGFKNILVEREGAVLWITINRPKALNSLDPDTHFELDKAFNLYATDDSARVAVITGSGDRSFCVGSDIKGPILTSIEQYPPSGFGGITCRFDLYKPVIACVNGLALGGGVEIVAACDLAIAADHAEFSLPEPRVGLAALGGGGLQRLARQMPMKHAMDLVLTGRRVGAEEAKSMALINQVVPKAELRARTMAMANQIIEMAPLAIEASKQVMVQSYDIPDLKAAIRRSYPAAVKMLGSEDAKEGPRAFAEKRAPVWRGR
jgi:crotonobetainyl-CoA hydratase